MVQLESTEANDKVKTTDGGQSNSFNRIFLYKILKRVVVQEDEQLASEVQRRQHRPSHPTDIHIIIQALSEKEQRSSIAMTTNFHVTHP